MVAETKETMNRMFDSMSDTFRAAFDAGQRAQETFFRSTRDAWPQPVNVDRMFNGGERVVRDWVPFVEKNVDTVAKTVDANFRAGMDMFKTACDVATRADDTELYRKTRQYWDTAFEAMRANFDVFTRMTSRTFENYAGLCECFRPAMAEPTAKSSAKPAKGGE